MVTGVVSFLLLQAGRGKLFPDFKQPYVFVLLFVLMGALIAYAYITRER